MLINPFTPAHMATTPAEFFGRNAELEQLARFIRQGSVAIQGPIGIGKSSLLARTMLHKDSLASEAALRCFMTVAHADVKTVDDAAKLVLQEFAIVDEEHKSIKIGIPDFFEYESGSAYQCYAEGKHLSALTRIIEDDHFKKAMGKNQIMVVAIDEADKCPAALARLMRTVSTKTQLRGINNLRFVLAGVSPFVAAMVAEDGGVDRFIYRTINLKPFEPAESEQLLEVKFQAVLQDADDNGIDLRIQEDVVGTILKLSGGHPHLLQLLGSHVIEHECADPDGVIDTRDLVDSLRTICYESRRSVYDTLIHKMQEEGKFATFLTCIELAGGAFPGIISRRKAIHERGVPLEDIEWLLERNILSVISESEYRIVDEFLRIRAVMDREEQRADAIEFELLSSGELSSTSELDFAHQIVRAPDEDA
jgi:hypothetical protein